MNSPKKSILDNPKISFAGSIFATIISLIGLIFAYKAYDLSVVQYKQERMLILKGIFDKKNEIFSVESITENAHFLRGEAYFPPSIHTGLVPIDSSGTVWYMGEIILDLSNAFAKKVKPKEGYVQLSNGDMPILIKSYYAIKGETYTDTSMYMLGMQVQLGDKEYSVPDVSLSSLIFIKRYPINYRLNIKELDNLINNEQGLYIPEKQP